jgi:TolA-binding protein
MLKEKHDAMGLPFRLLLAGVAVVLGLSLPAAADEQSEIQSELQFASELVKWRFPDYAQKAVDRLTLKYPAAKAEGAKIRVDVLTSRGKFEEAEALLKSMPPGTPETMVIQLALADQYYAFKKMKDAERVYQDFFKQFPKGPPESVARLYGESAYKFSQMLLLSGDLRGALEAYRRVLACPLKDTDIQRRVMTEMAELSLRVAELPDTTAADKKTILAEANKLCEKVQWKGTDLWFAKTVVIMAHIRMINNNNAAARQVIIDYLPMINDVDKLLREAKETKLSPMAECKFLLGTLYEEEGRQFVKDKTKFGEGVKLLSQAMSQLWSVAKNYPWSSWAPEARTRADAIADMLEKDFKKKVPRPKFDNDVIVEEQLKEARLLFQNQDFQAASGKYIDALNFSHDFPGAARAVSDLACCYLELKDDAYARAMTEFLAERYSQTTNRYEEAGNAMLTVASQYDERQAWLKSDAVYQLYFKYFPNHTRLPFILFRQGEAALRQTNTVAALQSFQTLVDNYPRARVYPDALSRLAFCLVQQEDHTNAIPVLTNYIAQLSVGAELLSARLRLADEYRSAGMVVPALNEYARLIKLIKDGTAHTPTPEDAARARKIAEVATYSKAQCYTRLREPAAQLPVYQAKAIEGFEQFLKEYPKSELAPSVLGAMGALYSLLNKPDEAGKAFDRLSKEYSNSPQAQNMVFTRADALMSMGEKAKAVKVFAEMLKTPQLFDAPKFFKAGQALLDANEYETAVLLMIEARKTKDTGLWQAATVGLGKAQVGAGQYEDAIKDFEAFLEKYKKSYYVIEVNLSLSRCYAEMAKKTTDPVKAKELFNKAFGAMSKVRQYAREPEMMVKADLELAGIQVLMDDKMGAMASYQRILLFADANNAKVRPHIESAFERSLPLFRDINKFDGMLEACDNYMKQFPQGLFIVKARQGRDEAKARLASGR